MATKTRNTAKPGGKTRSGTRSASAKRPAAKRSTASAKTRKSQPAAKRRTSSETSPQQRMDAIGLAMLAAAVFFSFVLYFGWQGDSWVTASLR